MIIKTLNTLRRLPVLGIPCLMVVSSGWLAPQTSFANDVTWYDGKKAPLPRGALLTNNPGYWGRMTSTTVSYRYEELPTNPPDVVPRDEKAFGNRLLDGQHGGDWTSPVGINGKPLVVEFDFNQAVLVNDVAVAEYQGQNLRMAEVEVRNSAAEPWKNVFSTTASAGPLHHMVLTSPVRARYVRLKVQSVGSITYISQMWIWGEGTPVPRGKKLNGFLPGIQNFSATKNAVPGNGTTLSAEKLQAWRKNTGFTAKKVTWQVASPWQALRKDFLKGNFLPGKAVLRQPLKLTATREEGTSAAVYLVNATDKPQKMTVRLSPFKDKQGKAASGIESELYVAGSLWTRRWGQALRPLFSATNKLDRGLMEDYLTNGEVIKDFPTLHLPPGGTALLWVTAQLKGAAPGAYTAAINTGSENIPLKLQVQPLTLPLPNRWVRFWGNEPASSSNLWTDEVAVRREMGYQRDLGASVWNVWPEENNYAQMARQILAERDKRSAQYVMVLSADIQSRGYTGQLDPEKFDDAIKNLIREKTLKLAERARELGLSYADWSIELWDEPTVHNMKSWAAVARLVKEADPRVQIYMNPLFWTREGTNPEGFVTDERQVKELSGWYNELVDISVPIQGQVNVKAYPLANAQFYNFLPRKVRAYFTHPNPGRSLAWEAFTRGYNGWGSYAYFSPRKDPWNDFDHPEFDYQIVYPGPDGYIPTIESESMRESWEDYRLLTLLQQQGKTATLDRILKIYESGIIDIPAREMPEDRDRRSEKVAEKMPELQDMALKAALSR
jgi:hypothetical protein